MKPVSPGQKIRIAASDWNSMQEAADAFRMSKLSGGSGRPTASPPERFRNDGATAIPRYGVGCVSGAAYQGVNLVQQATDSGSSRLVIASAPCSPGKLFEGWTEGLHPVRVSNWAGVSIGDRIGAQVGSWDAVADAQGPMMVTGKLATPLVVALFVGQAGLVGPQITLAGLYAAPAAGCIAEITGCESDRPVFMGTRPTRTGLTNFVILTSALSVGATGNCVSDIGAEATVLAAGTTGYAVGDSLGVVKDSWYATANRLGSMEIIGLVGVVTGNTQCRVRITGKRGDNKIVKLSDGSFVVVESIEFDETVFSVAAGDAPGLTEIS